jgi:putative NADPH-quinone reductase
MQLLDRIFVPGSGIRAARHRILVVNGHPDPRPARFCSALCDAYEEGARSAGWTVRRLTVGCLASGPAGLRNGCSQETALEDIAWATQLFVVFPLWSDQPPPILRDLFQEYVALNGVDRRPMPKRPLRMVITMEMPAFLHRAMPQCGTEAKGMGGTITLPGFDDPQQDFIGSVAAIAPEQRRWWLQTMRASGIRAI